jgi:hypothetical protein
VKHFALSLWLVAASCSSPTYVFVNVGDTQTQFKSSSRFGGQGGSRVTAPNLEIVEFTFNEVSLRDSVAAVPGAWGAVANTLLSAQSARLHAAGMGIKLPE